MVAKTAADWHGEKRQAENYFKENGIIDPRGKIKKIIAAETETNKSVVDSLRSVLNRQFPNYDVWNKLLDDESEKLRKWWSDNIYDVF